MVRRVLLPVLALLACLWFAAAARAAGSDPFAGTGMWIWQLSRSEHGDVGALASRARAAGVDTLIVKGAGGTTRWGQFSPALVRALHAQGLNVCVYHFLYGRRPVAEAAVSAQVVAAGADCLVVDVEGQYG
ncbi:MAG TPA: hypothetical protein VGJ70_18180, partial [Solirubrobacteraceae bacterium]